MLNSASDHLNQVPLSDNQSVCQCVLCKSLVYLAYLSTDTDSDISTTCSLDERVQLEDIAEELSHSVSAAVLKGRGMEEGLKKKTPSTNQPNNHAHQS